MGTITLIRPARVVAKSAPHNIVATPPIGLAYIAGVAIEKGFPVSFLDAFPLSPDSVEEDKDLDFYYLGATIPEILSKVDPNSLLIGISAMFSQEWFYTKKLISFIHKEFPHIPIVLGGEHITADPFYVLRSTPPNTILVLGEGEETFSDLLVALKNGEDLSRVEGIAFWKNGEIILTPRRKRIRDIDSLPYPAWDLVPIQFYLDHRYGYEEWNRRSMPMLATRGCPYQCTFCSNPAMWTTRWIPRKPEEVVKEMEYYLKKYRIEHVEFYDLTAIVDKKWILRFTEILKEKNLPLTWRLPSGTRSEALDYEVLKRMKETGCEAIVYAPESGSPTTLERIKKKVKPERMLKSMRSAVKLNFHTRAHFIMGIPGQTPREVLETFWFIVKIAWVGIHDITSFFFYPYPGSTLYQELVRKGKIDPSDPNYDLFLAKACFTDFKNVPSYSEYFSPKMIRFLCLSSMGLFYFLQFLFRPYRLFPLVLKVIQGKPFTWLERFLSTQIREKIFGRIVRHRKKGSFSTLPSPENPIMEGESLEVGSFKAVTSQDRREERPRTVLKKTLSPNVSSPPL